VWAAGRRWVVRTAQLWRESGRTHPPLPRQ